MTTRRSFLMGLFGSAAAVSCGEASTEQPAAGLTIGKVLDRYGEDMVWDEIQATVQSGAPLDLRSLNKRCRSRHQREIKRPAQARKRREAHAGDDVLYHGPVAIDDWRALLGHYHPSPSKRYDVARTLEDWAVYGRQAARPEGYRAVERDGELIGWAPDRDDYSIDEIVTLTLPPLVIRAGSRVLIGTRNGGRAPAMACEVIRTGEGDYRVHLYSSAHPRPSDDLIPVLAVAGQNRGRRYETQTVHRSLFDVL